MKIDFKKIAKFFAAIAAIVAVGATGLAVYFSSLTAYAVTAYEWKLREGFFSFIMGVMMIPAQCTMIGFFKMVYSLHMTNNLLVLILPSIAAPSMVFFMRQYLQASLSMEIVQSARIDGAKEFKIFTSIIMPLIIPSIAMTCLFIAVGAWNSWFDTYMYCSPKKDLHSLQYVLMSYLQASQNSNSSASNAQSMAVAANSGGSSGMVTPIALRSSITVVATLPILVVYPFVQKYFVVGMTIGGVKE